MSKEKPCICTIMLPSLLAIKWGWLLRETSLHVQCSSHEKGIFSPHRHFLITQSFFQLFKAYHLRWWEHRLPSRSCQPATFLYLVETWALFCLTVKQTAWCISVQWRADQTQDHRFFHPNSGQKANSWQDLHMFLCCKGKIQAETPPLN